jgi:hypothetical protein
MLSRGRAVGLVSSLLAMVVVAGCATQGSMVSSDIPSIAGVWEGEVWETPSTLLQGIRRITLNVNQDGSWTATSAGTQCASGTASVRGGVIVLGGTRPGPDFCMPYSVTSKAGRMKAMFETSFKARQASAMIGLERVRPPLPAAAQAPTQP